jgi:fatty acid desaturase
MPEIEDRDEQEEREYRAAMRRLKLLERRVKLALAALFITAPFVYLIGAAVAAGFGAHPADLPWPYLVPFIAAGLVFIFNFDLRDVLILFGNMGAAVAKLATPTHSATGRDEGDE